MSKKKFLITAAPPTSNGNLHIGHLAGPFLGADVFSRFQRMLENDVLYISYGDDYQDYVDRKARETNQSPKEVSGYYTNAMGKTLKLAKMLPDHFPGTKSLPQHKQIMQEIFTDLYNYGSLEIKEVPTFYCSECENHCYEAYARGECHYCGSKSDANYCENCGHPQEAGKLVNAKCTTCQKSLETRTEKRIYFSLVKYRESLQKYFEKRNWRVDAEKLCKEILNNEVDAPITRKAELGVEVPLDNMTDHILDTWYGGPAGYISACIDWASNLSNKNKWEDYWKSEDTSWVAFVGFDCTFSHGVFYPGMLMAQDKYTYPDTVITNKFYGIDQQKISTSRNHAIWGSDIFRLIDPDVVRFYLCLTAPENEETDFQIDNFKSLVNNDLANKWNTWLTSLLDRASKYDAFLLNKENRTHSSTCLQKKVDEYLEIIVNCHKAETFSLQRTAKAILGIANESILHYEAILHLENLDSNNKECYIAELKENLKTLRILAIVTTPIMPEFSKKIKALLGNDTINKEKEYLWSDLENEVLISPKKPASPFFTKVPTSVFDKLLPYEKVTM
ncbi:class I tRNA ligase family protein [Alteribacillus sp. HJP-4]|uniref:class I tRNA ligase family protein n=1 Tax=Alteribacillus sp. HJP-4 TaxID=2775394 RepID=UPI0035CD226B